ncbi:restriction endonuclease subunit S [Pseudoalteromonas sp. CAL260-MNA-CIBAN-0059]|uniref:restriction endonuclease subunit S n=1 Tax=Pseudoalteromonas sp. CAL260-MNA-CIBAN-0059 TaxID=3140430 RepID=UPI00332E757F|tara:strand:+ start:7513 stop:8706 length:1194 start_codon:yes stop_codon:yes gene_type:complete
MLDMEAIKNFSIDKSDWQKVKFGDVVFEPKESVKDPVAEGIEHVVGLEHIDSEDIHLRRSASIEESTTFTKKFCKGDVLFGRRRAYLKKAAKASFEGICSGDITVMRATEELLHPELLPFVVNNNKFFEHAVQHSAGGLSPRVKFKDLAQYEFHVPSKAIQSQMLSLFEIAQSTITKEKELLESVNTAHNALLKELEMQIKGSSDAIGDFVEIKNGFAFSGKYISNDETDKILMTPGNFNIGGGFSSKKFKYYLNDDFEQKFILNESDLIITMTDLSKEGDTLGSPAFVPTIPNKTVLHNQRLGKVEIKKEGLSPDFLLHILQTPRYRSHILRASTKTTVSHTYPARIKGFKFNNLKETEQLRWVIKFRKIRDTKELCENHLRNSIKLTNKIIEMVF